MIQWDKFETFNAGGHTAIRYAFSEKDGVSLEMSLHDPTIQSMFPQSHWFPIYSAPTSNAKIDRIDGKLVVLMGFGKPNDPLGNLMLMRVWSRLGYSKARMGQIITFILISMAKNGIQFEKTTLDTLAFEAN
jgi:hypothetical protein